MKKLIVALSAALLLLSACGEKTKTIEYNGVKITYPGSWTAKDIETMMYFQDQKVLSNSADVEVIVNDADEISNASSEDLAEYLKEIAQTTFEDSITDDYEIRFQTEIKGTDSQAMMSLAGTAFGEEFSGAILAWLDENYAFTVFFSAKDDDTLSEIMETFNFEIL